MKKLLSYLLSPFFWIYFCLILAVFQPIQWVCFTVFGYSTHKRSVDLLNWFLLSSYRIMGTRLVFKNSQDLPKNRPILFVSNHQSMFDIPGLIWYLRDYDPKFVSKKELGKGIPSISYNLNKSGAALIDRNNADQAIREIERLGNFVLKNRYSIVLFPEGNRSPSGHMKAFKLKGFSKFMELIPEVLVVPIAIHNSWKFSQFGFFPMSFGETLRWNVLMPLMNDHKSASELLIEAEKAIKLDLGQ